MRAPAISPAWREASLAAAIFAVEPSATGVALRAKAGPARDAWLSLLKSLLPNEVPIRRAPLSIDDHALLGGLDLNATLAVGRPIASTGLLAEVDGGVLILAMAERLTSGAAVRIAAAMDSGEVFTARDGLVLRAPARFGVVALDEGESWNERPPGAMIDRLALHVDLSSVTHRDLDSGGYDARAVEEARARLTTIALDDDAITALTVVAEKLGIHSIRAPLLALRTARALCALRDDTRVSESDLAAAARLVLASRAESLQPDEAHRDDTPPEIEDREPRGEGEDMPPSSGERLENIVLAAAAAAIPPGLLSLLTSNAKGGSRSGRGPQSKQQAKLRGRPLAARRGELRDGRLSIIDTLRAAAPLQKLRRPLSENANAPRIIVRPDDFRIVRRRARRATTAIFVVDASGSAAAHRLAEVKGAIELLLADCYTRRDSVAMISFRGKSAETILAPTRSLTRAKRALANLPGGGGTPLALGLDAAVTLAEALRRKGEAPLLVLMTDGCANIGSDGKSGRARAFEDALNAGRRARAAGLATLAIDTSSKSQKQIEAPTLQIGRAMNARYIELPTVEAARVTEAVRAAVSAA
jgi:magnesium chelatase subunit D